MKLLKVEVVGVRPSEWTDEVTGEIVRGYGYYGTYPLGDGGNGVGCVQWFDVCRGKTWSNPLKIGDEAMLVPWNKVTRRGYKVVEV